MDLKKAFPKDSREEMGHVFVDFTEQLPECVYCEEPTETVGEFTMEEVESGVEETGELKQCTHCGQIYLMFTEGMPAPADILPKEAPLQQ